jgi:PAS domain S-box-containing protein
MTAPPGDIQARPTSTGGDSRPALLFILFLLTVTLLLGAIGGFAYRRLHDGVQQDAQRTLAMIAEQKRQQIEDLMSDARADVRLFTTHNTQLATQLGRWSDGGRRDPAPLEMIRARMGEVAQQRGWDGVAIFDADLRPVITIGEIDAESHLDLARVTLVRSGVQFIDLHRHGDGGVHYGVMAPIAFRDGAAMGVLYLTWAAERVLYPLVASWPVPTRTAETFLVRREDAVVRFLTPLRGVPGAVMSLHESVQSHRLPAALAVQGRHGIIEGGVDYRGVPVLAYATPIADTPWAMVAKIDEDEAFAGMRATTRITALVMGLALLTAYGAGWLLWRQDRRRRALTARQAQEAAEARFYTMFEQLPLGVALADLSDGRLLEINQRFAAIVGRPPAELLTGDWTCFTHPDDMQPDSDQMARLNAGEIASYHLNKRYLRPDGAVVWVSLTCAALQDDTQAGRRYLAIVEDITERTLMEAELRRAKERLEAMFSALPDLMFRVDRDGRIEEYHSAANDLLYLPPAEFLGRTFAEVLPAPAAQVFREAVTQAAIHGTHRGAIYALDLPKGQSWFELSMAAMGGSDQPCHDFIAVVRDITERKQAEEALRAAEARALDASRAKSEFLAHMSHEIRTPLNGVLGLAQVLCRGPLSDHQRGMVERIQESGQSLLAILNDILDFSKIEAGQLRLEIRPFDLAAPLARLDSLMGGSARAKGLGLRLELLPAPLGRLMGDALRLEQVLLNLVGNAVKFTSRGEIVVHVQRCAAGEAAVRLRFEVRDTGIGIAPEVLAGLFTPFIQADAGISRHYGGTGLGLSISKRLVELMDGTIGATSQPGQGSTFWFEVPFARADADAAETAGTLTDGPLTTRPPAAPITPATGPRLAGLHLLVVDDSAMNREVVERALSLEGAITSQAADGQQALQMLKARTEGFDAVLMDVRMPVMDGLTATRLIRDDLGLTGLPVIALTAGVMAEEQEAVRAAGMNDFLAKPLDLEQMVALLLRWVEPRPALGPTVPVSTQPNPVPSPIASPIAPGGEGTTLGLPDIPGIDRQRAAQTLGLDPDRFLRLLAQFAVEFADAVARTREDLAQGERETAIRRVHTLRGNAGNLGAIELMQVAGSLEEVIVRGEVGPAVEDGLAVLDRRLTDLIEASAPWRVPADQVAARAAAQTEIDPAPAGEGVPPPPLDPDQLAALREALSLNKAKAQRLFKEQEPALRAALGPAATGAIALAIRELRYEAALAVLDQLAADASQGRDLGVFPP